MRGREGVNEGEGRWRRGKEGEKYKMDENIFLEKSLPAAQYSSR